MDRYEEIRERASKATPGPWHIWKDGLETADGDNLLIADDDGLSARFWKTDDAAFCAYARQDIHWLLGEVETLRAGQRTMEAEVDRLTAERDALEAENERLSQETQESITWERVLDWIEQNFSENVWPTLPDGEIPERDTGGRIISAIRMFERKRKQLEAERDAALGRAEPAGQQRKAWIANGGDTMENACNSRCKQPRILPKQQGRAEFIRPGKNRTLRAATTMCENVADTHGNGQPRQLGEPLPEGRNADALHTAIPKSDHVSNPKGDHARGLPIGESAKVAGHCGGGQDASNAHCERLQAQRFPAGIRKAEGQACPGSERGSLLGSEWPSDWWATEPDVGRVANGVPAWVDRLKCLGNAVVPQQFFPIFAAIAEMEKGLGGSPLAGVSDLRADGGG